MTRRLRSASTNEAEEHKAEGHAALSDVQQSICVQCDAPATGECDQEVAMLKTREQLTQFQPIHRRHMMMRFIPHNFSHTLGDYPHPLFCGKFNQQGDVFMSACQDGVIRLYSLPTVCKKQSQQLPDQTNQHVAMPRRGLIRFAHRRSRAAIYPQPFRAITCRDIGWSIISTAFSPDDRWFIYSSWSPFIHLCNMQGEFERHEALQVSYSDVPFCLFSTSFSPNATHIVGGANDAHIYSYNLETKRLEHQIDAHADDVNAICYLDNSGQVLVSGSDDSLIKLWDMRVASNTAQGLLCGHAAGITCLAAREDGWTVVSNGKDQQLKVWDVRKALPANAATCQDNQRLAEFDYRRIYALRYDLVPHANDVSVHSFRGHAVMETLIRCDFSPMFSTGQRYVYSGSATGEVFIWDILTGELVHRLQQHDVVVRDASWHPFLPLLASSSWDCTVKIWSSSSNEEKTNDI